MSIMDEIKKEIANINTSIEKLLDLTENVQGINLKDLSEFPLFEIFIRNKLIQLKEYIDYLNKPIKAEGTLYVNNIGRYAISDEVYFKLSDTIEALIEDEELNTKSWVITKIDHNGKDYILKDRPGVRLNGLYARCR